MPLYSLPFNVLFTVLGALLGLHLRSTSLQTTQRAHLVSLITVVRTAQLLLPLAHPMAATLL
jgi:type III secretory pathway component EscS